MEWTTVLLFTLIGAAFITDAKAMVIPNRLTLSALLAGLLLHTSLHGWSGLIYSAAGAASGFGMMFVLYWTGALGAGDVKLFAALGACGGAEFVLYSSVYSILYAAVIGIAILLITKQWKQRMGRVFAAAGGILLMGDFKAVPALKRDSCRFPFMYAVLPGAITAFYYIWEGEMLQ